MANLDPTLSMLKDLTDAKGIPGNEREVREVMKKYITPYADEITTDGLGGLIAKKEGQANGPKIMLSGHLDEVGFMVKQIDDKGFIRFQTVGGWWSQVMLAQRVTVVTSKGESITGVIGSCYHQKQERSRLILKICLLISVQQVKRKLNHGAFVQVT